MYNEKYLKAKMKSCKAKINSYFPNNEIQIDGPQFICLSLILINSAFRAGKNYYHQVFLEECKYVVTEKTFMSILLTIWKFLLTILIENILKRKIMIKNSNEEHFVEGN